MFSFPGLAYFKKRLGWPPLAALAFAQVPAAQRTLWQRLGPRAVVTCMPRGLPALSASESLSNYAAVRSLPERVRATALRQQASNEHFLDN